MPKHVFISSRHIMDSDDRIGRIDCQRLLVNQILAISAWKGHRPYDEDFLRAQARHFTAECMGFLLQTPSPSKWIKLQTFGKALAWAVYESIKGSAIALPQCRAPPVWSLFHFLSVLFSHYRGLYQ